MSRSNPTEDRAHPCAKWFEWDAENGSVRYYDKTLKKNVDIGNDFTFILLDQLAVIKGWHDKSNSGITSNEVRDTTFDQMAVRSFEGGPIATGLYSNIKDRVIAAGGYYCASCYIAYKDDSGALAVGNIQLKRAALNQWVEFKKKAGGDVFSKAIRIQGYEEGKKGKITFRTPKFLLVDISKETNDKALELDKVLQAFLVKYLAMVPRQEQPKQPEPESAPVPLPHTEREKEKTSEKDGDDFEIPF